MTYKGQEIGIPTLELIQECINQWKLRVPAQDVYEYWSAKNWLTSKGQQVKTLESACNVANSLFVQRQRKDVNNNISKSELEEFERLMGIIREKDPISWSKFFCMAANLVKEYDSSHGYYSGIKSSG